MGEWSVGAAGDFSCLWLVHSLSHAVGLGAVLVVEWADGSRLPPLRGDIWNRSFFSGRLSWSCPKCCRALRGLPSTVCSYCQTPGLTGVRIWLLVDYWVLFSFSLPPSLPTYLR